MSIKPQSKGKWGLRPERTAQQMNEICKAFFDNLIVPTDFKFMTWSVYKDGETIISVGKIFRDTRTSGINLKEYRIFFYTWSERGGILEKKILDFGKFDFKCVIYNKTVEKLNEWIKEQYTSPPAPSPQGEGNVDQNDGLQHFRDRFGDNATIDADKPFDIGI